MRYLAWSSIIIIGTLGCAISLMGLDLIGFILFGLVAAYAIWKL